MNLLCSTFVLFLAYLNNYLKTDMIRLDYLHCSFGIIMCLSIYSIQPQLSTEAHIFLSPEQKLCSGNFPPHIYIKTEDTRKNIARNNLVGLFLACLLGVGWSFFWFHFFKDINHNTGLHINIAIDTNVLQDKKIFLWGQILKSADFNAV